MMMVVMSKYVDNGDLYDSDVLLAIGTLSGALPLLAVFLIDGTLFNYNYY